MTGSMWKSRTFWMGVLTVGFNAWQGIMNGPTGLSPQTVNLINGIAVALMIYFRINPAQNLHADAAISGGAIKPQEPPAK